MKRTILISVALLVLIIGGVYLAQRGANTMPTTGSEATSTATSTGATPGRPTTVIPEEGTVTLALGETAAFRGFLVTPTAVVEDSRCPAGVYCIQAGTVRVKLEISSGLGTSTKTVKLGDSITTEAEMLTFVSVEPLKTASSTINPKDYRFTVKVEKRASGSASGTPVPGKCYVGGCSSEVCSDNPDAVSTCIYKPEFACYKTATCERQASGACGWTQTTALTQCIANAS